MYRLRGHSSAGRALRWQCKGQGFEPPWLHYMNDSFHPFHFQNEKRVDFFIHPELPLIQQIFTDLKGAYGFLVFEDTHIAA